MNKKVLLISGYKRSGKDTVANYLIDNRVFSKVSFAASLKDLTANEFNIERNILDDQNYKESPLTQYPVVAKDSFAKKINDHLKMEFRTLDNKQAIDTIYYGSKLYSFYGIEKEPQLLYWTPRALMIFIGSVGRAVSPNHWVDRAINISSENNLIISDFRYVSEYDRIVELVGEENVVTMRINRFKDVNSVDDSEKNLDDFNFNSVINNTGTLEELFNKVDKEVKKYGF
jgi:hypothetical protein